MTVNDELLSCGQHIMFHELFSKEQQTSWIKQTDNMLR
jgi:hypothetical protein